MLLNVIRRLSTAKPIKGTKKQLIKIDLVPSRLHRHLFGGSLPVSCNANMPGFNGSDNQNEPNTGASHLLDQLELPELRFNGDLMSHLEQLGREQFQSYEELLELGVRMNTVPSMPLEWRLAAGWTVYDPVTGQSMAVDYPNENLLFFDVEVCVKDGQLPTLAVALSSTRWYSWCSDRIAELSKVPELPRLQHLIPLEGSLVDSQRPKIVIGHNIAYDRSRVREQYLRKKTPTRFWDTMSMSIAICGMADHQRLMFERSDSAAVPEERWLEAWRLRVCKNSLEAVHAKFCGETSRAVLKKQFQDVFVKENIETIRDNFQILMSYCANDVLATFEVFQALYPQFRERFPSRITYSAMLEMASAYLPVTSNWRAFYAKCERSAGETRDSAARAVVNCARQLVRELTNGEKSNCSSFERDPWLWISDWRCGRDSKPAWFQNFFKLKRDVVDCGIQTTGKDPTAGASAEDDCENSTSTLNELSAEDLRMMNRDMPRVFGLCYGPYPLFFKFDYGWGFLMPQKGVRLKSRVDGTFTMNWPEEEIVRLKRGSHVVFPNRQILELIERNRSNGIDEIIAPGKPLAKVGAFDFYRLPHPNGTTDNVGSPFVKSYWEQFEQKTLWAYRFGDVLKDFLDSRSVTRFWGNYRERFHEQLVVWLDDEAEQGAIAPSIIPCGTVTRRAVHKLWLVSTNAKQNMIGSDLKSMVECPPGWSLVGADVDSQEQWIAAMFGDSAADGEKHAGGTEFSNMLLAGDKSQGTDLHSVVARESKVTRDHAKVLNYARLYGAGKGHAVEFLKQKGVSEKAALTIADRLFSTTKGTTGMYYELNAEFREEYEYFLKNVCRPEYVALQGLFVDDRHFVPVYCKLKGELSRIFEKWILQQFRENPLYADIIEHIKTPEDLHTRLYRNFPAQIQLYRGGFESCTFNFLELRSGDMKPRTPILGCRLSRALEIPSSNFNDPSAISFSNKYKRSVINWFVQSSAVDFLHMLLVCMSWLCHDYNIDARFVISIHDEVRYLVKDEDRYRCALALVLSNMYTRAAISNKLGINELPLSVAFFTQVDVDKILRKEVDTPCYTPAGDPIPAGEGLNIEEIIQQTGGSLRRPSQLDDQPAAAKMTFHQPDPPSFHTETVPQRSLSI